MLDCVEALDHVCPLFLRAESLLGFEQRWEVGWMELHQSMFSSICSSKLEASQACLQRLQLFLKMDVMVSELFIFRVSRSKSGVVNSWGTYFSSWCMHDKCMTCNLYDEFALQGVTYDRNYCIMKQESWFLPKLYNENFWVTIIVLPTSLEFKMLQKGFALMQTKITHTT